MLLKRIRYDPLSRGFLKKLLDPYLWFSSQHISVAPPLNSTDLWGRGWFVDSAGQRAHCWLWLIIGSWPEGQTLRFWFQLDEPCWPLGTILLSQLCLWVSTIHSRHAGPSLTDTRILSNDLVKLFSSIRDFWKQMWSLIPKFFENKILQCAAKGLKIKQSLYKTEFSVCFWRKKM